MGEELVYELNLLHLIYEKRNTSHKLGWSIVVKNVHIHHLTPASQVSRAIVFHVDKNADSSQYESTRIDGFEISSRHL